MIFPQNMSSLMKKRQKAPIDREKGTQLLKGWIYFKSLDLLLKFQLSDDKTAYELVHSLDSKFRYLPTKV